MYQPQSTQVYGRPTEMADTPSRPQSPLFESIQQLTKERDRLRAGIQRLAERLDPILMQSGPATCPPPNQASPTPMRSGVASALSEIAEANFYCNESIEDLLRRIDL